MLERVSSGMYKAAKAGSEKACSDLLNAFTQHAQKLTELAATQALESGQLRKPGSRPILSTSVHAL